MLKFKLKLIFFVLAALTSILSTSAMANVLYLRDNLKRAHPGDYIVTAQNKNYTLLHVYNRSDKDLTLEEITVPIKKYPPYIGSWKQWIQQQAPGNTSWIMYTLDLNTGKMTEFYSVTNHKWYDTREADSFLNTLLNIPFSLISLEDRRRVGFPTLPGMTDNRPFWQPKMVFEGREVPGVWFDAWTTRWPKDGSDLADKTIEVFIPQESNKYPSYFPYWLQISGLIGKAKIRIIDSGSHMKSPTPPIESRRPPVINKKANS
jgi:hypothetical protein